LSIELPHEVVDAIAERVLELIADRHQPEPDGFLDVAGAASYLACKPSWIYALVSAKRIPVHRDGSRLLFDRQELRE
jgi:excisionase family DNA binding protein